MWRTLCNHCGFDIQIQPPRETGCNHAYYPEGCKVCSSLAEYKKVVTAYDISKITTQES